ncbi:MAG: cupin domain-containing protein [Salinirussus sp.]
MATDAHPAWVHNLRTDDSGISRVLADGLNAEIFAGEESMLSVVTIDPHSEGSLHSHPEEQWGILIEGECIRIQGGEEYHATAGDFWHTPGGVEHAIRTGEAGALVLDVFAPPRPEYRSEGTGFETDDA